MKNSSKNKRLDRIPKHLKSEVEADLTALAEKIKKKRIQKGITQEGLAEILSVDPTTIQAIERSRSRPSLELLIAIIKVLDLKITFQ